MTENYQKFILHNKDKLLERVNSHSDLNWEYDPTKYDSVKKYLFQSKKRIK